MSISEYVTFLVPTCSAPSARRSSGRSRITCATAKSAGWKNESSGGAHERLTGLARMSERPPRELKARFMGQLPPRKRRLAPLAAAAIFLVALALAATVYVSGLFSPDAVASATLRSPSPSAQAGGKVLLYDSGENMKVKLDAWGLPPCKTGQYYELWFVKDGRRVSGGTFTIGKSGRIQTDLNAPRFTGRYPKVGITYEVSNGDPGASDKKMLGGELHQF